MPRHLLNFREKIINICSIFPSLSCDIISHYFGQHSVEEIMKETAELVSDGILSAETTHLLDRNRNLFKLTDFGVSHLQKLQIDVIFEKPKETKHNYVQVLRIRELFFLLDIRIAFLSLFFVSNSCGAVSVSDVHKIYSQMACSQGTRLAIKRIQNKEIGNTLAQAFGSRSYTSNERRTSITYLKTALFHLCLHGLATHSVPNFFSVAAGF